MLLIQRVVALRWLLILPMLVGLTHIGFSMETKKVTTTDPNIKQAIQKNLNQADSLRTNTIQVNVSEGCVTLTGVVPSLPQKHRAERYAQRTRGVRTVKNDIMVKPNNPPSDEMLRTRIASRIAEGATEEDGSITVTVDKGNVTLAGTVASRQERMRAEDRAGGLHGVTAIKNKITVHHMKAIPDAEIQKVIVRRFQNEPRLENTKIVINVDDSKVELTGSLASVNLKEMATGKAWVTGVTSVDVTGLEVDPNLTYAKRDGEAMRKPVSSAADSKEKSDAIQSDVGYALLFNTATFDEMDIEVTMADGSTVILEGVVSTLYEKNAATEAAHGVKGVQKVDNRLTLEPLDVSVTDLTKDAQEALDWSWSVDRAQIEVTADKKGMIQLNGTVESEAAKQAASDVVANVKGVTAVENSLVIADGENEGGRTRQVMNDQELKEEVESWLWWNMTVDSDDVNVQVKDGVVSLKGKVDSQDEMREAVTAAQSAGAKRVVNQLQMRDNHRN